MFPGLFHSTSLPALEQTTVFTQRRHELLAGNVANIDTPGYRARDLSVENFETSLATAIRAQQGSRDEPLAERSFMSPGHMLPDPLPFGHASATPPQSDPMDGPRRAMETLVYHDGSDVNLERQVTEIAKNQHLHNMAIALMRSQFSVLRAAISERV